MSQFNILRAQENFGELINKASFGEQIIITKDDEPIAKIVSAKTNNQKRQIGIARGLIKIADDFNAPLEELSECQ